MLRLAEPVPEKVMPAPLLCPEGDDLVDEPWWAFGFPQIIPVGNDAHGTVGAALGYGWVRLDTESRYVVAPGFSGAGLWSPRFESVVGLVGQAQSGGEHRGDALAVTLWQVDRELPAEKLAMLAGWSVAVAGESALAAWGWSLEADVEAGRHWRPRARGVSVDAEAGYRFRGRRAALAAVVGWLDRPVPDGRVLVVTGSPGVGKSAVLGRVVTTADAGIRAALPAGDDNVKATVGSVACAVHVKGKTALDVAVEVARAAAVRLPAQVSEFAPALRKRLAARVGVRFNLVLDALDEAVSPDQARQVIEEIVLPVAQMGQVGAQVVVGTRRRDDGGDLVSLFGTHRVEVDLDTEEFFAVEDLTAYAMATLQLSGAERAGNPYADDAVAAPVAARIAVLAERNFLVAGLVARSHGLYDTTPVDPDGLAFPADVDAALDAYIQRLPAVGAVPAKLVFTALAYAQAPGLSLPLWRLVLAGLGARVGVDELAAFVESSAANFLVESSTDTQVKRFRLFHQALNDALLRDRRGLTVADQRAITRTLVDHGRGGGWATADRYLWRSLPAHAEAGGMLDELLTDDEYLLHVDLFRLMPVAEQAISSAGRQRARLLRLTLGAVTAGPAERAAMFSVTAVLEGMDTTIAVGHHAPYRGLWAAVTPRAEWAILEGHTGWVEAVCAVVVGGRTLLVSAGQDKTVRLWDPDSGRQERVLEGHTGWVEAVCAVVVGGRALLVSAGQDMTVRLWDPDISRRVSQGRSYWVWSVCGAVVGGRVLPASVGSDATVRLWDLDSGRQGRVLEGHAGGVQAVCGVVVRGRTLLASAGDDATVRLWDPDSGRQLQVLEGHTDSVRSVCAVVVDGRSLLASAGDRTVRLWDPASGALYLTIPVHHPATACTAIDDLLVVGLRTGVLAIRLSLSGADG